MASWQTNFINTAREGTELIREVHHPNFQLILDVASAGLEETSAADAIRSSGACLKHFHANDVNRRGPGFGAVDFVPIFKALKGIQYPGYVSLEVFDFKPDPVTIARESIANMRKCLQKVNPDV